MIDLRTDRPFLRLAFCVALVFAAPNTAFAVSIELLTNGDFETGNFNGWTVTDDGNGTIPGNGSWFVDVPGSTAPISGLTTSAAGGGAHGSWYALSDMTGAGLHVLTQSFTVAAGSSNVILSFDMFVNNYGSGLACNGGLNWTQSIQCARVDILSATAPALDTGAGVLQILYLGADGAANPNPFTHYSFDISAIVGSGGTFQVRFAEDDYTNWINQGVDNISIQAAVPEPSSAALLSLALVGLAALRRRNMRETLIGRER